MNQDDLRSEIATLVSFEADGELIDRLKRQHPTRKVHHPEHDNNFWRAWNEAAAFCWAVSSIDAVTPKFVGDETGLPDIEWGNERWLEVKTVDNSPKEIVILNQQAMAGFGMRLFSDLSSPNPNVLRKFEYHLQDTLLKAARTKCGELVLFLSMRIDGGTSHRKIREAVTTWAVASASHWGVRIVVANGLRWDQPFVDTGPTEGKRPTTHDGSESPQS